MQSNKHQQNIWRKNWKRLKHLKWKQNGLIKKFPLNSPQICTQVGEYLLETYPHLTVDVHHPDSIVYVEVRDYGAYIRGRALQGAGGIPVGTGGKEAAVLISGGIDSPVASWMMAKRGVELTAIHFARPSVYQ